MPRSFLTTTNADVRSTNRLEVLDYFRNHGDASRSDLAQHLPLSPASVTNITNQLLDEGALIPSDKSEVASTGSAHGRPRVTLQLNPGFQSIASCVLSFNGVQVQICDYQGAVVGQAQSDTLVQNMASDAIVALIIQLIESAQPDANTALSSLAISTQGETDAGLSRLLWSPILFEEALDFPQSLASRLGCQVTVANDATMIAMGYGQGQENGHENFGAVLMSYGIGLGLQLGGSPFTGIQSSATEMGHMPYISGGAKCRCGKHGCIEAYASDYAIYRRSNDLPLDQPIDQRIAPREIDILIQRAQGNDPMVIRALEEAANSLGFALASLFSIFDVFPVVFVGPAARLIPLMEDQLRRHLRENFRANRQPDFEFTIDDNDLGLALLGGRMMALRILDRDIAERR